MNNLTQKPYNSMYGAAPDAGFPAPEVFSTKLESGEYAPFVKGKRTRLNLSAMWVCLMVPWINFVMNFGLLSSWVHYENPWRVYCAVVCSFFITLIIGAFAYRFRRRRSGETEPEPNWLGFLFLTCMFGWVVAVVLGVSNFVVNTQPYENLKHLNTYTNIDPVRMRGQQLMDAGVISFSNKTEVDITKAMGFKNLDTYCVAPITIPGAKASVYDFWAVGINCCTTGVHTTFTCDDATDRSQGARGGLRLLEAGDRPFYRLAVQQAEVKFAIKATHPLFFHWEHDGLSTWKGMVYNASKNFLVGLFGYFIFQAFMTVVAALGFARMGKY